MVTEVRAGPYTIRGISLAGVYTSLHVPELHVVLDVGVPLRSFASSDRLFLSHTHADHASALPSLLGIRNLIGKGTLRIHLPQEAEAQVRAALEATGKVHHTRFEYELVPLSPGDTVDLGRGLHARAFRTHHSAPSLGYQFLRRVTKLRPEFRDLPSQEVGRRRMAGDTSLFEETERLELAYATDTQARVLDTTPELLRSQVLILEATYLDERRAVSDAQERGHVHLDEVLQRADRVACEALVLMHFSQIYSPREVRRVLAERVPPSLREVIIPFAPETEDWFG